MDDLSEVVRSRRGRRLPVVLTKVEVAKLFQHLHGVYGLMAGIIYGAGFRLRECVQLRIKDIDLDTNLINMIGAKGDKDRTTLLAQRIKPEFIDHIENVKRSLSAVQRKQLARHLASQRPGAQIP